MDLDDLVKPAKAAAKVAKDPKARAYAKMMDRRKQKQGHSRGPESNFKKRK